MAVPLTAPLPQPVVKQLHDRLYERRKAGALEIEKIIKEHNAKDNKNAVEKIIQYLGTEFASSANPQPRNGGLIGLAACAIALGKDSSEYVGDLVKPALGCFADSDQRIRYYACEALYNICKVTRSSVLPFFNEIFDGLGKLADDYDSNVRNGSELLDRLIKDIVTESSAFNVPAFMPLLRERIYTRKPFCRRFIVSWISLLNSVPDMNMLVYLPEFLDGLYLILGEENQEIKYMCEQLLKEFRVQICSISEKKAQGLSDDDFSVDFAAMTNILITHSQSTNITIQSYAVDWLRCFVELAGRQMLPFCPGIVKSILPTLSESEERQSCRECAKQLNALLTALVTSEDNKPTSNTLDSAALVKVLCELLSTHAVQTKIACLKWLLHLFNTIPNKIFLRVDEIFELVMSTLSDPSDEVVLADLHLIAQVAKTKIEIGADLVGSSLPADIKKSLLYSVSQYFIYCMQRLLDCFKSDRGLLDEKGLFIIRHLALLLNPKYVYQTMSQLICVTDDLVFAAVMIRHLNIILLTASELFPLRNTLKHITTEEGLSLFRCLYMSWCHNPVAAVSLCLLTQQYRLSSELLYHFGDIDITVEVLTEVDKLVQLLESPIFIYLRLQLLDASTNHYLIKSLYSILMLLPQSEAFKTLQARLQCVNHVTQQQLNKSSGSGAAFSSSDLVQHFISLQAKHSASKQSRLTQRKHLA